MIDNGAVETKISAIPDYDSVTRNRKSANPEGQSHYRQVPSGADFQTIRRISSWET